MGETDTQRDGLRLMVFGVEQVDGSVAERETASPDVLALPLERPSDQIDPEDYDCVVVRVPSSTDAVARMDEVLAWAEAHGMPVVLASANGGWTSEALHAYNHTAAPARRVLRAQLSSKEFVAAVGAAAMQFESVKPDTGSQDGVDYVVLGAEYTLPENEMQYRAMRLRSILDRGNRVTEEACQQYDLAKQYIKETKLPSQGLPWNPDMSVDAAPTFSAFKKEQKPSLKSVFQFHGRPDQGTPKALLHPNDQAANEWRQPPAVLIQGDTGTGKTELAHQLTRELFGQEAPFVLVSGGQLRLQDLTPDLHGLAAGSATSIVDAMPGQLAQAAYGVAFLDELGAIPMDVQKALLPFFDDGIIRPRGIGHFKSFLTVIAATDADLRSMIAKQQFSPQLRARFKRFIRIPALHERSPEDRERLIHFAAIDPTRNRDSQTQELRVKSIHPDALERLAAHEYRNGNFRELEVAVHTAIQNALDRGDDRIELKDVPKLELPRHLEATVYRADPPPDGHVRYFAGDAATFHRIAIDSGSTIQQTADGALYLVDQQGLLCLSPDAVVGDSERAESGETVAPTQRDLLRAIPDPWGRFLVADEAGFHSDRDLGADHDTLPLGVSLGGDLVACIAANGQIHTFPPLAAGPDRKPLGDNPAECLTIATDGSLIARLGPDLVRYKARQAVTGQLRWSTRPAYPWEEVDATAIVRAFLVPGTDGEEQLWWVAADGTLDPNTRQHLAPVAAAVGVAPLTSVHCLDLLQCDDRLWVVMVLPDEPDARQAVVVAHFDSGQFGAAGRPLSGSAARVRKSDRLNDVAWVRGRPGADPMLVVDLDRDRVAVRIAADELRG